MGTDVALPELDDLRLGPCAVNFEHHVLCSGICVLGQRDLGMRDADARGGDRVRPCGWHGGGLGEPHAGSVGGAGLVQERGTGRRGQKPLQFGVISHLRVQDAGIVDGPGG